MYLRNPDPEPQSSPSLAVHMSIELPTSSPERGTDPGSVSATHWQMASTPGRRPEWYCCFICPDTVAHGTTTLPYCYTIRVARLLTLKSLQLTVYYACWRRGLHLVKTAACFVLMCTRVHPLQQTGRGYCCPSQLLSPRALSRLQLHKAAECNM